MICGIQTGPQRPCCGAGSRVLSACLNFGILLERIEDKELPRGHFYAHIPSLGLTTHGLGIEGALEAARDLLQQWIAKKRGNHEAVPGPGELFFSTLELSEDALQSA